MNVPTAPAPLPQAEECYPRLAGKRVVRYGILGTPGSASDGKVVHSVSLPDPKKSLLGSRRAETNSQVTKENVMGIVKQILASFEGSIPSDSKTAAAIARNATPEEISEYAAEEGLHALASALFEASQNEQATPSDTVGIDDATLAERLQEFRRGLPPGCEAARLIDAGASLEEISEAAQKEGLTSLVALLVEVEQERA